MGANSKSVIESCMVFGFVGVGNPQQTISPVHLSGTSYYTPVVQYPGLMTQHALSEADCSHLIKTFAIIFGVIVFIVELIQVRAFIFKRVNSSLTNHLFTKIDLFRLCCWCLCKETRKRCSSSQITRSTDQRF